MPWEPTAQGKALREFIIANVEANPYGLVKLVAEHFGFKRRVVYDCLRRMRRDGLVTATGNSTMRRYFLADPNDPAIKRIRGRARARREMTAWNRW
ncbi:MAG TPA: hypothetical protein VF267_05250 [Gammaproteobacteria bacterium]